ncbi:hypothetical protein Dda_0729 [Drechslerella dactyloides]|uniref:Uncharacterized protein n=1 Tax=Drechslerella dactyloides TaxID=74499 RepID=A0AAD6J832_DREDA|nr:hypothetical protein Dda_0729 [Drechslerella dactyloides]
MSSLQEESIDWDRLIYYRDHPRSLRRYTFKELINITIPEQKILLEGIIEASRSKQQEIKRRAAAKGLHGLGPDDQLYHNDLESTIRDFTARLAQLDRLSVRLISPVVERVQTKLARLEKKYRATPSPKLHKAISHIREEYQKLHQLYSSSMWPEAAAVVQPPEAQE